MEVRIEIPQPRGKTYRSSCSRLLREVAYPAAALFAVLLFAFPASASDYQVLEQNTEVIDLFIGDLHLTESVVQDGPLPINRFTMTRLRRPNVPHKGVLLLLPSLGNNFGMYLFDEGGDVRNSFAAVFARLGYDVWGYSPRTTGIASGDCYGGGLDCAPALEWGLQTIVDDVSFIRSQIADVDPGASPVVGGLSLGAISAIAVVNQNPNDYAGLLAWEGSLVSDDLAIQAHNQVFCGQFGGLIDAGLPVDDQSLPFVKLVSQLAEVAPNDPFALPAPLPPGLTNHQAFVFILSTPNPIAPSPRPGFITAAGDFVADQLFFSDEARLMANIAVFNDATSNRVNRDFHCALAGTETTHTANLAAFSAPLMVIKAGQGFGSVMDELPGKVGSTSVTTIETEPFGHVDHLGSPYHWFLLEIPIAKWLKTEVQH